jgi:hypothetical protein
MTKQETDNYIKIGLVILAVIVILAILGKLGKGVDSFLESLGLKKSEEEKKAEKTAEQIEDKNKTQPAAAEWQPKDFNVFQPTASIQNLNKWEEIERKNKKAVRVVKFNPDYFAGTAKAIYKSVGVFSDSPEEGLAQIKGMRSKAAFAYLSLDFTRQTGKDLLEWLKNKYDTEYQKQVYAKILEYISNLPVGVIDTTTNRIKL